MAGLDTNKISNILGTKIPQWLLKQLDYRSQQNTQDRRDNNNILFLANKTAWIRLVSSIDIVNPSDIRYFQSIVGNTIQNSSDLAKQFVLFGGTSKYLGNNSYGLRAGLGKDGAYGILGNDEIQRYGYKPMPGITSVTVDTQGKLGSLRSATINFKCWDKAQLDIIDALYFKLGFTMFLEWGHTFFYPAGSSTVQSTELYSIDPFRQNLTKEEIGIQISKNIRQAEGNYDAMLGMVTNFNFSYNQDGGYDCTLRLMGLGILGDAIKINNPKDLPNILAEEIKIYNNTLSQIATAEEREKQRQAQAEADKLRKEEEAKNFTLDQLLKNNKVVYDYQKNQITGAASSYASNVQQKIDLADITVNTQQYGQVHVIKSLKGFIPVSEDRLRKVKIKLNPDRIIGLINQTGLNLVSTDAWGISDYTIEQIATNEGEFGAKKTFSAKWNWDSRTSGLNYVLTISRTISAKTTEKDATQQYFPITLEEFRRQLLSVIKQPNNEYAIKEIQGVDFNTTSYTIRFSIPFTKKAQVLSPETYVGTVLQPRTTTTKDVEARMDVEITFEDSSFIKSFTTEDVQQPIDFVGNLTKQNQQQFNKVEDQSPGQDASIDQITQALQSQSGLELTLRTIQVHALNRAINQNKTPDLEIGRKVYRLQIANKGDLIQGVPFYKQIFSNGVFSNIITDLIDKNKIPDQDPTNPDSRFRLQSKYGFATELMAGRVALSNFIGQQVDFEELLSAYVVPYQVNQEIVKGTTTNHPVYIPLGLLLMILNHSCTIYDTKDSSVQTPLVYIDFNPNLNFFLTNTKQLSTNPFKVLVPFQGSSFDYQDLFSTEILSGDKTKILPLSGSNESTALFDASNNDLLSGQLPQIKFGTTNYRGKLMNILLNIDYVVELVKEYSLKDGTNNIYLKTFLEQVVTDVNKYLGNFNSLRVAYNDGANTFQIVDDQVIPPTDQENILEPDNTTNLPLLGKSSIAKTLEIKTEISSKLSNMIAISANADVQNKATLSTNGDNFGFINTNYRDRYIPIKGEVRSDSTSSLDSVKASAIQFNQTISDFYSKINPSEANVSQATNYYIEKMSRIKNKEYPTRASTMIPVSVNFTTDGVSGFTMGQGFTIPDELLPYTYNNRTVKGEQGLEKDHINKVGFVVVGLTNVIESNVWNTSVRANMIFLKNATEFSGSVKFAEKRNEQFGVNPTNENESVPVKNTNFVGTNLEAKKVAETYLGKTLTDQEWSQLVAATYAEASPNQEERAWVMAVILNRTRTGFLGAKTILDTLTRKSQFQAVTGTSANGYQPSSNYVNGPDKKQADSIYGAVINFLPTIPKNYLYFTSNVAAAYGAGTNIGFLTKLKSQPGSKIIGQTVFAITA